MKNYPKYTSMAGNYKISPESSLSENEYLALIIPLLVNKMLSYRLEGKRLTIGTFDNCREYGLTYKIEGAAQSLVFCIYEHRNSDSICINGCYEKEIKPYGPYNGDDKWGYFASYPYQHYTEAAKRLADFLVQSVNGTFDTKLLTPC